MIRLFYFIFPVIFVFSLIPDVSGISQTKESSCIKCHEETYIKAVSSPYQHSVMRDDCTVCHEIRNSGSDKRLVLWSSSFQTEGLVYLGPLDGKKKYRITVEALDSSGKKSRPESVDIKTEAVQKFDSGGPPLKKISGVTLDEIRKGIFMKATISWVTGVPATSEIEYRSTKGKFRKMSASENLFTKEHRVTLKGLKRDSIYFYRVISKDISGNTVRSEEYTLDTSGKNRPVVIKNENIRSIPVVITDAIPLRVKVRDKVKDKDDYYLRLASNKYSQFIVWLKEITKTTVRPCSNSTQTRSLTIDACIKCHPQDSSHPVGVRSSKPKIKVSDELPTIDNGVITCVSCHYPHGGEKAYFVRVTFSREICIKCHEAYYD